MTDDFKTTPQRLSRAIGVRSNGDKFDIPADPAHGYSFMDAFHQKVHQGRAWTISNYVYVVATENYDIILEIPSGVEVHLGGVHLKIDRQGAFYLGESPTYTGGSTFTPDNRNRVVATNPKTVVKQLPATVSFAGSTKFKVTFPVFGASGGEFIDLKREWILAGGNNYLLRVSNDDAVNDLNGYVNFDFYEEIVKI